MFDCSRLSEIEFGFCEVEKFLYRFFLELVMINLLVLSGFVFVDGFFSYFNRCVIILFIKYELVVMNCFVFRLKNCIVFDL